MNLGVNLGRNALRALATLGVAGALTAGIVGAAGTASAAPAHPAGPATNCSWQGRGDGGSWQASFAQDGVNIRTGPGTDCTAVGAGYTGQTLTIYCGAGTDSNFWWYSTDNATGVTGWVFSDLVNFDPENSPPLCG